MGINVFDEKTPFIKANRKIQLTHPPREDRELPQPPLLGKRSASELNPQPSDSIYSQLNNGKFSKMPRSRGSYLGWVEPVYRLRMRADVKLLSVKLVSQYPPTFVLSKFKLM